jgi:hypothetical protein
LGHCANLDAQSWQLSPFGFGKRATIGGYLSAAWNRARGQKQPLRERCREETNLVVRVERLLFDVAADTRCAHDREHPYLCTRITGEAAPGYEPDPEFATAYSFIEVRWVPLTDEAAWGSEILDDPITRCNLHLLQQALGCRLSAPGARIIRTAQSKRSIRAMFVAGHVPQQSICARTPHAGFGMTLTRPGLAGDRDASAGFRLCG